MLRWLKGERPGDPDILAAVSKRAQHYALEGESLIRILPNGARRPVPPVDQRHRIVKQLHERCGHFGRRRTAAMVRDAFYWPKLYDTCSDVVSKCDACARYRTTFDKHAPHLNPLEVKGMYYRFSTDLAKMPRKAKNNYQYVMVVVEHFTKYVCLIPLHTKEPVETAQAFALHVIARFGCPAEVVTDNGGEWEKEFAQLLKDNLIDHRTTSQSHPQSNGLSERIVQMTKAALTKACKQAGSIDRWDSFLPWIMLGYNATPQESTRLAPYELVYAQRPTLPPAIKERLNQPLESCMDVDAMAASYLERAEYVKRATIMAGSNIAIAQHRQTERYAQVRSGKYLPKQFNFRGGDFVFLKRSVSHGLQLHTRDPILQIKELPDDGTAVLQGRCGSTCDAHCSQIAICHLPDVDPTITYNLDDNEDARCQVCKKADRPASILLCDDCNQGYHLGCLQPKLTRVPSEEFWYCPRCLGLLPDDDLSPQYLTAYENRGKQLDGKRALKVIDGKPYEGTIRWLGAAERPYALKCEYDDGDSETFTLAELQQYLLPDNATAPQKQAVAQPQLAAEQALHTALATIPKNTPSSTVLPTPFDSLPSTWDLSDRQNMLRATATLLPGHWDPAHITKLTQHIRQQAQELVDFAAANPSTVRHRHPMTDAECQRTSAKQWGTQLVVTTPSEIEQLATHVTWHPADKVWDPYAGTGAIEAALHPRGVPTHSSDINPAMATSTPVDALQPENVRRMDSYNVVVTSPAFRVLDIALPLLTVGRELTCAHVPLHYVFDAHAARRSWLWELAAARRMSILLCKQKGPLGRRNVWLIIADTATTLQRRLKPQAASCSMSF
ncbi:hypothetical protein CYMTET_12460 [Cymbomonas tetramitiformis]|uniref:Uncharacterized protein n=1 Tax=Cymbomonas tetramitiformis TaxID=36881 RepID=A0AAE0LBT9_9CHLO|nr:hypothetical protein CYMTET_12460 [Cymbomonas tetramitiformis]